MFDSFFASIGRLSRKPLCAISTPVPISSLHKNLRPACSSSVVYSTQADFTGLGVVVMDALLYRPWWEEEDFAKRLLLPSRAVRQVLRLLETVRGRHLIHYVLQAIS